MINELNNLRNEHEILDIFCELVQIPSPSLKEEKVVEWIFDFCNKNNIQVRKDDYGNVYISVPANDETKAPIMVSAHMDVVGDDSSIELQFDGQFIKANGRTLGADDKVGVACGLLLAKEVSNMAEPHGLLEVTFTRDEETGMYMIFRVII